MAAQVCVPARRGQAPSRVPVARHPRKIWGSPRQTRACGRAVCALGQSGKVWRAQRGRTKCGPKPLGGRQGAQGRGGGPREWLGSATPGRQGGAVSTARLRLRCPSWVQGLSGVSGPSPVGVLCLCLLGLPVWVPGGLGQPPSAVPAGRMITPTRLRHILACALAALSPLPGLAPMSPPL